MDASNSALVKAITTERWGSTENSITVFDGHYGLKYAVAQGVRSYAYFDCSSSSNGDSVGTFIARRQWDGNANGLLQIEVANGIKALDLEQAGVGRWFMRRPAFWTTTQHSDFSSFFWYLLVTLACCWASLFYLLFRALH